MCHKLSRCLGITICYFGLLVQEVVSGGLDDPKESRHWSLIELGSQ